MISISNGLKNSMVVLELLRNNEELKDVEVDVGAFTNCREVGLTFKIMNGNDSFTWCVYEHRNSDQIIVNGKEGYINLCGDLPYKSDDKYDYLNSFDCGQYERCAKYLADEFIHFVKN